MHTCVFKYVFDSLAQEEKLIKILFTEILIYMIKKSFVVWEQFVPNKFVQY